MAKNIPIDASAAPALAETVFVNVWTASDARTLDELATAMKSAAATVAAQDGFVSLTLFVERDGLRLIALGRWRDVNALVGATESAALQGGRTELERYGTAAEGVFDIVDVVTH